MLQKVKHQILTGWPEDKTKIPEEIRIFHQFKNELTIQNDIIMRGTRVVIPRSLVSEIMR